LGKKGGGIYKGFLKRGCPKGGVFCPKERRGVKGVNPQGGFKAPLNWGGGLRFSIKRGGPF